MCGKSSYPTEGIITEGDMDVRFKGVRDTHNLAKQLDNIIIRGLKLYVNIPRYNRERLGQRTPGNKSQDKDDNTQHEVDCCKKKKYTNQGSYAAHDRNQRVVVSWERSANKFSYRGVFSLRIVFVRFNPS